MENDNSVYRDLVIQWDILAYSNRHLVALKIQEKKYNKKRVHELIKKYRFSTTREIFVSLQNQANSNNKLIEEQAEEKYQKGEIYSKDEKTQYIRKNKEKPITMRTIQNIINEFEKEGVVKKEGRRFDLSNNSEVDFQYELSEYGKLVIEKVLSFGGPLLDEKLRDLVTQLGMIILFNFILIYEKKNKQKNKQDTPYDEIESLDWFKDVVSIDNLYYYLFKLVESHKNKFNNYSSSESDVIAIQENIQKLYPVLYCELLNIKNSFNSLRI